MEIHILREGTELGPFTEEVVQSLLQQGSVSITDLSWRPGLGQWIPLANLLYATALPTEPAPVPEPATAAPAPARSEPATARQKAFLSYLGIVFAPEMSKLEAAELVNETMENPRDSARLAKWNEDRLKLHPELFASELQALKEGRAQRYFEICQDQGAEYFSKVTKAHTQVLVGYLDVSFPRWDADERAAAWNYFFPAIAEKFPQLVNKEAKGKFKYPEGPKVAAELARHVPVRRQPQTSRSFPLVAAARGVFFGVLILAVIWYVKNLLAPRLPAGQATTTAGQKSATAPNPPNLPPVDANAAIQPPPLLAAAPPAAAGAPANPEDPAAGAAATPLPEGTTPPASAPSLFGLDATPTPAAVAVSPARTNLLLTRPVDVQLAYGRIKLPPGTAVKLLQQNGTTVKVSYLNNTLTIPITSTDLGTEAPPHLAATPAPTAPPPEIDPPEL